MKIIQVTMDAELAARVDECAGRLGATRSGFTRDALRAALRRYEEKDLEKRHTAGYARLRPNRTSSRFRKTIGLGAMKHGVTNNAPW